MSKILKYLSNISYIYIMALVHALEDVTSKNPRWVKVKFNYNFSRFLEKLLDVMHTKPTLNLKERATTFFQLLSKVTDNKTVEIETSNTSLEHLKPIHLSLKGGRKKTRLRSMYKKKLYRKKTLKQKGGFGGAIILLICLMLVFTQSIFSNNLIWNNDTQYNNYRNVLVNRMAQGVNPNEFGECMWQMALYGGLIKSSGATRKSQLLDLREYQFQITADTKHSKLQSESFEHIIGGTEIFFFDATNDIPRFNNDIEKQISAVTQNVILGFNELFKDLKPNSHAILGLAHESIIPKKLNTLNKTDVTIGHIANIHFHKDKNSKINAEIFDFNHNRPFTLVEYIDNLLQVSSETKIILVMANSAFDSVKSIPELPSEAEIRRMDLSIARRNPSVNKLPYYKDGLKKILYSNFDVNTPVNMNRLQSELRKLQEEYVDKTSFDSFFAPTKGLAPLITMNGNDIEVIPGQEHRLAKNRYLELPEFTTSGRQGIESIASPNYFEQLKDMQSQIEQHKLIEKFKIELAKREEERKKNPKKNALFYPEGFESLPKEYKDEIFEYEEKYYNYWKTSKTPDEMVKIDKQRLKMINDLIDEFAKKK